MIFNPVCTCKRWVRLSDLQLKSRLDWSEFEEEGGFWADGGKCDHCLANKVRDWQGRMIGESHGAGACYFVTLTVGGDKYLYPRGLRNEKAAAFHKADMQLYFKRLQTYQERDWRQRLLAEGLKPERHVPPSCRHFFVGERGDSLGRIHYHCAVYLTGQDAPEGVLFDRDFFHGKMDVSCNPQAYPSMPRVPSERTYWPWGFSHWKHFDAGHAGYVASYINKRSARARGNSAAEVMRPGITTKPLFGGFYFDDWARRHVEQMLPLQDRIYTVPKAAWYFGPSRKFFMSKAAVKRTIMAYAQLWDDAFADDPHNFPEFAPESRLVRRFFEAKADRKLGTPELAMLRASFFMVARHRLAGYRWEAAQRVTVEELADSDLVKGRSRQLLKGMFELPRTAERIAQMGGRRELFR